MPEAPAAEVRRLLDRGLHRFEPLAPDWFVRVVAPKKAAVPWADMVRFALSIAAPLLVGVLTGQGGLGGLAAMGALLGAFGDAGGPFPRRFRRAGLGIVAGLVGLLVGRLALHDWIAVPIVGVFGVVSALLSAINAECSFAGLQLLVYLAISSGPARAVPPLPLVGLLLAGAGWSVLLSFLQTRLVPGPERAPLAVAAVLDELVPVLRMAGEHPDGVDPEALRNARRRVTVAVGRAYDAIADARAHSAGTRNDLRRLAGVLSAVTRLAAVATTEAGVHPAELAAAIADVEALRTSIATGRRRLPSALRTPPTSAVHSALSRAVERLDRAGDPGGPSVVGISRRPLRAVLAERLTGRTTWLFALRLALTLMVAEAVTLLPLPLPRPYWLLLTTAVVLKPDFGSVFARGVQRTLGTLVGVLIGAAVLELVPTRPLLLVPVAVFAFLFPLGASRNFGMLSTFLTPLVLILVDFGGSGTAGVGLSRLVDTALGAAVVLLVGYLPWSSTWRPHLEEEVANAVDALADYARVALERVPTTVVPARRRAYAALSDVRSDLQGALAEPTRRARAASAWFPLVAQLEQTADDLHDASIFEGPVQDRPPSDDAGAVADALDDLARAIRERRRPQPLRLPEEGMLAVVGDDVEAARAVVSHADEGGRS